MTTNRAGKQKTWLADDARLQSKWNCFTEEIPSDHAALEYIRNEFYPEGLRCDHCGSDTEIAKKPGERNAFCSGCKQTSWFLTPTFFARKKCLQAWLFAIRLKEEGCFFNPSQFARVTGVVASTAQAMFKTLGFVVACAMPSGCDTAFSVDFNDSIGKRSTETPARKHPIDDIDYEDFDEDAEEVLDLPDEKELEEAMRFGRMDEVKAILEPFLSRLTEPVYFDTLCWKTKLPTGLLFASLVYLELGGVVVQFYGYRYMLASSRHRNKFQKDCATKNLATEPFVELIQEVFHSISRKYLQLYLASIWCILDKKTWKRGSLLAACLKAGPIEYRDLLAYVSPYELKIRPDLRATRKALLIA